MARPFVISKKLCTSDPYNEFTLSFTSAPLPDPNPTLFGDCAGMGLYNGMSGSSTHYTCIGYAPAQPI